MSVLYIRDKSTGKFVPIHTIQGAQGPMGAVDGLDYYEKAPSALGSASPGTSGYVARGDHVHPLPTPAAIGAATKAEVEAAYALAQEAKNSQGFSFMTGVTSIDWTGTAAPYTATVYVSALKASHHPIIDLVASEDPATAEAEQEAYAKIYKAVAEDGTLTLYAMEKVGVYLMIQMII